MQQPERSIDAVGIPSVSVRQLTPTATFWSSVQVRPVLNVRLFLRGAASGEFTW
jgi:hypothetical protein